MKEATDVSKEYLEKIERSRAEGDYQKVHLLSLSCLLHLLQTFFSVVSQVVKLCRECLGKQENVLADTHLYRLRVLSVASEVLSYLKSFTEAADFARRMVEGYT